MQSPTDPVTMCINDICNRLLRIWSTVILQFNIRYCHKIIWPKLKSMTIRPRYLNKYTWQVLCWKLLYPRWHTRYCCLELGCFQERGNQLIKKRTHFQFSQQPGRSMLNTNQPRRRRLSSYFPLLLRTIRDQPRIGGHLQTYQKLDQGNLSFLL